MKRQDIRLLAQARAGDAAARLEVGRRYLIGDAGFHRHVETGLEYLSHPSVAGQSAADAVLCEGLALHELLAHGLLPALRRAAETGNAAACVKLAAWTLVREQQPAVAQCWLSNAAPSPLRDAAERGWTDRRDAVQGSVELLCALQSAGAADAAAVSEQAARDAMAHQDLARLGSVLHVAVTLAASPSSELGAMVVHAVSLAEREGRPLPGLQAAWLEPLLEARATAGDAIAAYALGRALCGIELGRLPTAFVATGSNMRKGAALLLRAADAGGDEAWLHLYRIHADHRLSVSNPQMARFFLEKAAARGQAEAQRRLGALLLRGASTLQDSEQAIALLHQAAAQDDAHALRLLRSLILPVDGDDEDADEAIAGVSRTDPWLAARLRLAREFGLTKLEALCVDPVAGLRPWGLVVGRNPFITQIRLSAPRAVPAVTAKALDHLRATASFFSRGGADTGAVEGDLRRRSLAQRRAFARHGLQESMFFAVASSTALDALRLGPKWAFRARQPLQLALAD